jgi:hypothetical protein
MKNIQELLTEIANRMGTCLGEQKVVRHRQGENELGSGSYPRCY